MDNRFLIPLLIVASSGCATYSDYARPRGSGPPTADASVDARSQGAAVDDATLRSDGGRGQGGAAGIDRPDGGVDEGGGRDAGGRDAGGRGGEGTRDSSLDAKGDRSPDDARPDSRDVEVATSDAAKDAAKEVVDGGGPLRPPNPHCGQELRPVQDPGSVCGLTALGASTQIDFSCRADTQLFDFVYPTPVSVGPSIWLWGADSNAGQVLSVVGRTQAWPAGTDGGVLQPPEVGTFAIYSGSEVRDGAVSVTTWSTDKNASGVVARYQDCLHYYAFGISYPPGAGAQGIWTLARLDGTAQIIAQGGGISNIPPQGHGYPGHRLGLAFAGDQLTPSIDGAALGTIADQTFTRGRVGVVAVTMNNASFDDMTVVRTR